MMSIEPEKLTTGTLTHHVSNAQTQTVAGEGNGVYGTHLAHGVKGRWTRPKDHRTELNDPSEQVKTQSSQIEFRQEESVMDI